MTLVTSLPPTPATEAELAQALSLLVADVPALAAVAAVAGPLPMRPLAPGFPGLAWVVIGQQISLIAARAIHDRCVSLMGSTDAPAFAAASDEILRQAGLSGGKVRTLRAAAQAALEGHLDFHALGRMPAEEAIAALCALKGIGPWTAEVYLLFAENHPDVFPAGDVALQEAARIAFALPERPKPKAFRDMAEAWRPRRGIAARLLWAYYRAIKGMAQTTPV